MTHSGAVAIIFVVQLTLDGILQNARSGSRSAEVREIAGGGSVLTQLGLGISHAAGGVGIMIQFIDRCVNERTLGGTFVQRRGEADGQQAHRQCKRANRRSVFFASKLSLMAHFPPSISKSGTFYLFVAANRSSLSAITHRRCKQSAAVCQPSPFPVMMACKATPAARKDPP